MITMHILPNISRGKDNQTTKFALLIEYNMRNIFFWKNYTQNVVEKLVSDPFLKIYLDQMSEILDSFYCMSKSKTAEIN